MGLNIKNDEAHRLARELSALTGESMATVVTEALRERLRQLQNQHNGGLAERLVAIGKDCAARLRPPYDVIDHGELLYDDKGLPR